MMAFADLLDRLSYTPGRNAKIRLMRDYFASTPDPDRGWALAALTDGMPFSFPVRRAIADMVARRMDPELFRLSRDYVGDTAETVALVWPAPVEHPPAGQGDLRLADVVDQLALIDRGQFTAVLEGWLDRLDPTGRWALLKLLTGALRVGVSARLAKTALAELGSVDIDDVEAVWHGLEPPYGALFAWLEGRGPLPEVGLQPVFRPMMLAHPLEDAERAALDPVEHFVEWKWDGIRVQVVAAAAQVRLYSRTGDDIGRSFPELLAGFRQPEGVSAVLDGELLVVRDGVVAPFNDLQQRLNRRTVSARMRAAFPAHVRLYDALLLDGQDLRGLTLEVRRRRLEAWHERDRPPLTDLSPLVDVANRAALERVWQGTRGTGIEGLMLKRRHSPYLAGRPKGHWWKWKRAPLTLDCVLMYAQRGSGKRSSYYSDYTFGAWREGTDGARELVPVGKAYSGFTDAELIELDRWVRNNTVDRFGPVRAVRAGVVLEIAFDAAQASTRHKSGVAMRFPRIRRIRWDKPAGEADRLETLLGLIGKG